MPTVFLTAAHCGDDAESRRLELAADALEMEGYGLTIDAPRLRLALIRNDLEAAERLLESGQAMYFARTAAVAARLDALEQKTSSGVATYGHT